MGCVHAIVILMASVAGAEGEQTKDTEVGMIDAANRTVKLVAAGIGVTPAKNLGAKFVEVGPNQGREIGVVLVLRAAKATVQSNHAWTIHNIIFCSVSWRRERRTPFTEIDLHEPEFEVIFSIPKDAQGRVLDFDRWYLVSIKPLEAKKDQPKNAEKGLPGAGQRPIFAGPENRAVKLVGVRFNDSRQHDVFAKFIEISPQHGTEIELGLGVPAGPTNQTIVDVTHTRTMLNIIKSSVSWTPLPNARSDVTQWREPLFQIIFSIPQDAHDHVSDFTRWSLLSMKIAEARKTQPTPSDK